MVKEIDFGDIGIKIGDEIVFIPSDEVFNVCSGDGTPGNGGTLISKKDDHVLFTIKSITKKLLGDSYSEDIDVFSLFKFSGKNLRDIYNDKITNQH